MTIFLVGAFCPSAQAQLLNFHFSYSGNSTTVNPGVGIVTGEIIGLQDNSTSSPQEIIIDSSPLGNLPGGYAFTLNNSDITGNFQVTDGAIVSVSFSATSFATQAAAQSNGAPVAQVSFNSGGQNSLQADNGSQLTVSNLNGFPGATYTENTQVPTGVTVYCFGDSLSDIGNNLDSPYTNSVKSSGALVGGTWIQQLCSLLDYTITASNAGGTDYASGGAYTSGGNIGISMVTQVNTYLAGVNNQADPTALYAFYGGSNDIIHKTTTKNYNQVGQGAANNIMLQIEQLANAGAKNFLWLNMDALNITPDFSGATTPSIGNACVAFNQQWAIDMAELQSMYPTVNFVGYDFYTLTENCYHNGPTYGFSNVVNPWSPGATTLAYSKKSKVTGEGPNADQFMFWDSLHPTTHFDQYLADGSYAALEQSLIPSQSRISR